MEEIRGKVFREEIVPPGRPFAVELRKGQVLRLIDLEGQQVADLVCFNLHRLEEKLSTHNTLNLNRQIYPGLGYHLYSDEAGRMMTIVADTCGAHDILAGACSTYTNLVRYGVPNTPNCRDNLAEAVKPWGLKWKDVPYNMNVFMNCPIGPDGNFSIKPPKSKAGDYIDFRAEMDLLVAFSNCPQLLNACNVFRLKPLKVVIHEYRGT
jgi:urea carboxylase-associated protein 1